MGRLNSSLYVILKFTERPKTLGLLQKTIPFPGGNNLFVGDFHANLDKTNANIVQFTKR